ncbi:hypothetical protein QBC42DRAFT_190417 [Cladorrhinum samala]|uniref:Cytochrome P450 n=1 Tax=Cladorrhinum samala TaxID=585594 RepID=A0AAV9H6J4_9PEZI|nr:hypothetical protein QBC42DRAFT_190417 [Cladorrhinum samala]
MLAFAAISLCQLKFLSHYTYQYAPRVILPAIGFFLCLLLVIALLYHLQNSYRFLDDVLRGLNNTEESHNVQQWLHQQRSVINFEFAGPAATKQDHLFLRASANWRVREAFGIENSLTATLALDTHKSFLSIASQHVNKRTRDWTRLYQVAKTFIQAEIAAARLTSGRRSTTTPLAECVQCACLTVVLFDNFAVTDPRALPRQALVTIASEINKQWLKSKAKSEPDLPDTQVPTRSALLSETISSLNLMIPRADESYNAHDDAAGGEGLGLGLGLRPEEILGLIMPQYETLWRVVLLAFVTAYHRQPDPSLVKRVEKVPECLGNPAEEREGLKVAKESLRLYPSNKRIYRCAHAESLTSSSSSSSSSSSLSLSAADLELSHRHPSIWGPDDPLRFRPSRFDPSELTPLQRKLSYFPYSLRPHRCPAFSGFGDRMITALVVCLGRELGPSVGRVRFGGVQVGAGSLGNGSSELDLDESIPLPTGRDEVQGWVLELNEMVMI